MKKYFKLLVLFVAFLASIQNKAATVTDSLLALTKTAKDTVLLDVLNQLAYEYRNIDIEQSLVYADSAINLSKKYNNIKTLGTAYVNKGNYYRTTGALDKAKACFVWAYIQHNNIGYLKGVSAAINGIASLEFAKGNLPVALSYFIQSLTISEKISDWRGVAMTLNNIGVINEEQGNHSKSLEYYERAYHTFKEIGDENNMSDALNNMGNIYNTQGIVDEALKYYNQALDINIKIGDLKDESVVTNNIGIIYFEDKQYKTALKYHLKSLNIDEQLKDQQAIAIASCNIANCYYYLQMYFAARKYAERALQITREQNYKLDIVTSLDLLFKINDAIGDYKTALAYYKEYNLYSDSLYNEGQKQKLEDIEKQYEAERLENERLLKSLGKDNSISNANNEQVQQDMKDHVLVIAIVLVAFVIGIYLIYFVARKR